MTSYTGDPARLRSDQSPTPPAEPTVAPLTKLQARGLRRLGDIVIPGDGELPSFTDSGAAEGIDQMLPYMADADRAGLLGLLSACAVLPKPVIRAGVAAASRHHRVPEPLAAALRLANIGIKGVVHSLYWSDLGNACIHDAIGYRATIDEAAYEASLAHRQGQASLAQCPQYKENRS